jgi:glycosyltransferase involved in cell wall biosynthesis
VIAITPPTVPVPTLSEDSRYVFLTACRNEAAILDEFLREFTEVLRSAAIIDHTVCYVVDDLSTDRSVEILEEYRATAAGVRLEIIRAPTNLGNQGALFYGLSQISVGQSDVLITFDCDGEDDVRQIPYIVELGSSSPGKLVLIERGRRHESLTFKIAFSCYKLLFRYLTRQTIIPNNFLLMPGRYVPYIQRTPLASVHWAYAILKMRFPSVTIQRDRRKRYGGRSSQNLFMIASHGLVGLMVFYEVVIAKLLVLLLVFGGVSLAIVATALTLPDSLHIQRPLLWAALAAAGTGGALAALLLSAALAFIFKMTMYALSRFAAEV